MSAVFGVDSSEVRIMALRAGIASVEVTPPVSVELCGYGFYLGRKSTGVLDSLMAKALVLESGEDRLAIVACDLIGLSRELAAQTKALIEQNTGIPTAAVMLACSHTHSGPTTIRVQACGEEDPGYVAKLPEKLAEGAPHATVDTATAHGVTHLHTNTLISADWPGVASRAISATAGGEARLGSPDAGGVWRRLQPERRGTSGRTVAQVEGR